MGNGIRVNINGGVSATVLLDANTIRRTPNGRALEVISRNGTAGLDVTATNNVLNNDFVTTPVNQGFSLASAFFQSNCVTVCNTLRADIRGNTVPATAPNGELIAFQLGLIETSTSTLQLVDTGAASASCTAQLTETNTSSAGANARVLADYRSYQHSSLGLRAFWQREGAYLTWCADRQGRGAAARQAAVRQRTDRLGP